MKFDESIKTLQNDLDKITIKKFNKKVSTKNLQSTVDSLLSKSDRESTVVSSIKKKKPGVVWL